MKSIKNQATILDLLNKIISKAKNFRLQASKNYKNQGITVVPYESIIAYSEKFPENLFLINKNIIFDKSIEDSSYDIWKFDEKANYKKIDAIEFDKDFFMNLKTIKTIE